MGLLIPFSLVTYHLHGVTKDHIESTQTIEQQVLASTLNDTTRTDSRQAQQRPSSSSSAVRQLVSTAEPTLSFPINASKLLGPNHSFFNTTMLYDMYDDEGTNDKMNMFDRFHYRHAPILFATNPIVVTSPVRVRILLFAGPTKVMFRKGPTSAISDEMLNIVMDGFQRSFYFELLNPEPTLLDETQTLFYPEAVNATSSTKTINDRSQQPILWIIDMRRMLQRQKHYTIPEQILVLVERHLEVNPSLRGNLIVVFFDYRDKVYSLCRRKDGEAIAKLIDLLGSPRVRQVNQLVVNTRKWDKDRNFVLPGNIINGFPCFHYPALHMPYVVRSEYADAILKDNLNQEGYTHISDLFRPIDVAHFWNISDKHYFCNLRDGVNQVLLEDLSHVSNQQNWTIVADIISKGGGRGRTSLQLDYVEALKQSKIVIVGQRDGWEDHYRLFEAVIGGALVMTDPMLTLPEGYLNGTNIIIYKGFQHLRDLIIYYLDHPQERIQIAHQGWDLAMQRHRSYHWMEKLIFGKILST